MKKEYYVISAERNWGDNVVFWKEDSMGYTSDLEEAGLYYEEEAFDIYNKHHQKDLPVHKDVLHEHGKIQRVVEKNFSFMHAVKEELE